MIQGLNLDGVHPLLLEVIFLTQQLQVLGFQSQDIIPFTSEGDVGVQLRARIRTEPPVTKTVNILLGSEDALAGQEFAQQLHFAAVRWNGAPMAAREAAAATLKTATREFFVQLYTDLVGLGWLPPQGDTPPA